MSTHHHGKKRHHKHVHKRNWRETIEKYSFGIGIVLATAIGATVLTTGSFIAWTAYQGHLYQGVHGPELEAELGFTTDSPWFQAGNEKIEVSVIHLVPGGYMGKIGFRDGDVITSHSLTKFYKMLYTQRGRTVAVDVVDGGDGLPIKEREVRTLKFLVPPKR